MTVLVTGGAGYIGSHAAAALLEEGRKVVVLDDLSRGSLERVPKRAEFVEGSVDDAELVSSLIARHKVKAIMHFAGFIRVEESQQNPELYDRVNRRYSRALIECAHYNRVPHFIFSSSASVYGQPQMVPVREDAPTRPLSPYGESKLHTEQDLARLWTRGSFAILRYFNVAGCDPEGRRGYTLEEHPTHLIRTALAVARGKKPNGKDYLPIFGTDYPTPDGTAVRDYIHVEDLVDAHLKTLRHLEEGGASDTFNVGYGHGYSVFEVHKAAWHVTGTRIPLRLEGRREGDPTAVVADAGKLRRVLQWQPRFDNLEVMIRHQWQWERSQTLLPA